MIYLVPSIFLFIYSQLDLPWSAVCTFMWILPLIIQSRQKNLNFLQGFVWGLFVFGFHLSWLLVLLFDHNPGMKGGIVWMMAVIWLSCASGVWFWATKYSWIISTLVFFLFLTRCCLFPCGALEGYPLINPLLPFMFCSSQQKPKMNTLVFIRPWWYGSKNPMFVGYRMVDSIAACMHEYSQAQCMVMPESTFCFDLVAYEKFIRIWSEEIDGRTILLGGHRKSGDGYLNSVFALKDGKIVWIYDKQHCMILVERIPKLLDLLGCGTLFVQNNVHRVDKYCDDVCCINQSYYQIFVCSELFFQTKKVKGLPIIFLWNDSWLQFAWTKKLALKFIYYFSYKHSVAIIHASTQGQTNIDLMVNLGK